MNELRALLQNANGWFTRLTGREKRLVGLAGGAVVFFVIFLILFSFANSASAYRRRTETKIEKLAQIQTLATSYRQAEQSRQAVERQLTNSNIQLISYLQEQGDSAGLDIRAMNPKGDLPIGDGKIIETSVEVNLIDVQLDNLVNFLSQVERGPGVVKVKTLRLEPRPDQETVSAWTTIATYSMKK